MSPQSDSTFKLNRSVRESAEKIEALCQSTVTGNLLTIDRQAARLWNLDKLIKALHFTDSEYHPDVPGLVHLVEIDGYAAHLQSRKGNPNPFSVLKVWSSSLRVLYQVIVVLFTDLCVSIRLLSPIYMFRKATSICDRSFQPYEVNCSDMTLFDISLRTCHLLL